MTNSAMEKSNTKQMSITQYVCDRELGIRGMRKQRFVKQAEVTMYEDDYTEWPDHVQRETFVKFGKRMSQSMKTLISVANVKLLDS